MSIDFLRSGAFKYFMMAHKIGLFIFIFIFSLLQGIVRADAVADFFPDYNEFETDAASYDLDMFDDDSSSLSLLLDDADDSEIGLFDSAIEDDCSSWMSTADTDVFSMGQEARLRPRAESCPNQESSKPDMELPNFGVFNPGSNLFNLLKIPENPLKPPTQVLPEQPEQDSIRKELDRIFELPNIDHRTGATNNEENPCPSTLVSDLSIPVCDSGDWARDVLRIAGEYFFDLFNIRYCMYVLRSTAKQLCL